MEFKEKLASLGYLSYGAYLRSKHWLQIRGSYMSSTLPKCCFVCGNKRFELHHKTYQRLGEELLADLVPLCRRCHKSTHRVEKEHLVPLGVSHHFVENLGVKTIKDGFEAPWCSCCRKKCFVHETRFAQEVKAFGIIGFRWMCHSCRAYHGIPHSVVRKNRGRWTLLVNSDTHGDLACHPNPSYPPFRSRKRKDVYAPKYLRISGNKNMGKINPSQPLSAETQESCSHAINGADTTQ